MKRIYIILFSILFSHIILNAQNDSLILKLSTHLGGVINSSAIKGDKAFLGQGNFLKILDLAQDDIKQVSMLRFNEIPSDIHLQGDYAYLAAEGIIVVDISDPLSPVLVGQLDAELGEDSKIFVSGDYAYLTSKEEGLIVVDISDKTSPELTSTFYNGNEFSDIWIKEEYALISDKTGNELLIVDVSDKENLTKIASTEILSPGSVTVSGNFVYVTSTKWPEFGIQIVDITNPMVPEEKGFFETKTIDGLNTQYYRPSEVKVEDKKAYITCDADFYFFIVDVTNSSTPVKLGDMKLAERGNQINSLNIAYPYAYISLSSFDKTEGFREIDISDAANPAYARNYQNLQIVNWVQADTNFLYIAGQSALWIYDMADPDNPKLIKFYDEWDDIARIFLKDDILIAFDSTDMVILNVYDLNNVVELGRYTPTVQPLEVFATGDYAYLLIGDNPGILEVVNISNPSSPYKAGDAEIGGVGRDIYVDEEKQEAYVAFWADDTNRGFRIFDVSSPSAPSMLSEIKTKGEPISIHSTGENLFVATNEDITQNVKWYIEAFDISDATVPMKFNELSGEGEIWDIEVEKETILAGIVGASVFGIEIDAFLNMIIDEIASAFRTIVISSATRINGIGYTVAIGGNGVVNKKVGMVKKGFKQKKGNGGIRIITTKVPPNPEEFCCVTTSVNPGKAASMGCSASPGGCTSGPCGGSITVSASVGPEWKFLKWTGAASGGNLSTQATLGDKKPVPCQGGCANNATAKFTPWISLSGSYSEIALCPVIDEEEELQVSSFSVKASLADAWSVNAITVGISGSDEISGFIKNARLVWDGGSQTIDYSIGSNTLTFNAVSMQIPEGQSKTFSLYFTFKPMTGLECPFEPKELTIEIKGGNMKASPSKYKPGKKLHNANVKVKIGCVQNEDKKKIYSKIQTALDEASDGNTIMVCSGTYEEHITIDKSNIHLFAPNGPENTFILASSKYKPVVQIQANNVTVEGFSIRGAIEKQGIIVNGSTIENSILKNNRISNNKYGIQLSSSKNTTIINCDAFENKEMGGYVQNSINTIITGSSFNNNVSDGLYFSNCVETESLHSKITNSSMRDNKRNGIFLENCKYQEFNNNIAISNNDLHGALFEKCEHVSLKETGFIKNNKNGVKIYNCENIEITNNKNLLENTDKGIIVQDCNPESPNDNNKIIGNKIFGNRLSGKQKYGVYIQNSSYTLIGSIGNGNEIFGHQANGITIIEGKKNDLIENKIYWNDQNGIYMTNSCNNSISGINEIGPKNGYGLNLENCGCTSNKANIIKEANIFKNNNDGILLTKSSGNLIGMAGLENTITENNNNGVNLQECVCSGYLKNKVEGNFISNNTKHGISIESSSNNYIHKNNITSNNINGISLINETGDIIIEDNIIEGKKKQIIGISLYSTEDISIVKNMIKTNVENGIKVEFCKGKIFAIDNNISDTKTGIYIYSSDDVHIGEQYGMAGGNSLESISEIAVHVYNCNVEKEFTIANNNFKSNRKAILINNSNDIEILNNVIKQTIEAGIDIQKSNQINIAKNKIQEKHNPGIRISSCKKESNNNTTITENTISDGNSHGISIESSTGIIVGGAVISKSNDIKNNKGDGIHIVNCKSSSTSGPANQISFNTIHDKNNNGIYAHSCQDLWIDNNKIRENNSDGIHMSGISNSYLVRNTITDNPMNGIMLKQSDNNEITGNEINNNNDNGIVLVKSNKNRIPSVSYEFNYIHNNSNNGILIENSLYNKIWGNNIYENKKHGIEINKGGKNQIRGPLLIINNIKDGILFNRTNLNLIKGALVAQGSLLKTNIKIESNGGQGLHLKSSNNNIFKNIRIAKHTTGLFLEYSKNNSFYDNVKVLVNGVGGHGKCSYSSNYGVCAYLANGVQTIVEGCSVVPSTYTGTSFIDSKSDAIQTFTGGKPNFKQCNFINSNGYAINNMNDTVVIDARNNWWGDPTGPGGIGPGTGGKIKGKVLFEPWLKEPVSLQAFFILDTVFLITGEIDSFEYNISNLLNPGDSIKVSITDSIGWPGINDTYTAMIPDSVGLDSMFYFQVDQGIPKGTINKVVLNTQSLNYPGQFSKDSVYISVYEPVLSYIEVFPDTLCLIQGDEWQLSAFGFDQHNKNIDTKFLWSTSGGIIDSFGLYKATEQGVFIITAMDIDQTVTKEIVVQVGEIPFLDYITIIPEDIEISIDSFYQFEANGIDQYGSPFYFIPVWKATGGIIDAFGKYLPTEEGDFVVISYNADSSVWAEANIHVRPVATEETYFSNPGIILYQNIPNPFDEETTIKFLLQKSGKTSLNLYDIMGKKQKTLLDRWIRKGKHEIKFRSNSMEPGLYFYELRQANFRAIKKMVIF